VVVHAGLFDEAFLRKLERLTILSRRAMIGHSQGERRSRKRGQSVEFATFGHMRPGMTSGASTGMPMPGWNGFSSSCSSKRDVTVHLLVDTSRSMDWVSRTS